MKLTDLIPTSVDFKTCGLDLTFRPYTIADDVNAQKLCGGQKKMISVYQHFDFEKISLIAWYQLEPDSQKIIIDSITAENYHPETGEKEEVKLSPIEKFRKLIIGIGGQIELLNNLIKCKGLNIPDFDNDEDLKKFTDQLRGVK